MKYGRPVIYQSPYVIEQEGFMTGNINEQLKELKGYTFDGDTGRNLNDLYREVIAKGSTRDFPFMAPSWSKGNDKPSEINSYLDSDGNRFHVVWRSDDSGLSSGVDVILDAPSLKREEEEGSCDGCSGSCFFPPDLGDNN